MIDLLLLDARPYCFAQYVSFLEVLPKYVCFLKLKIFYYGWSVMVPTEIEELHEMIRLHKR